MASKIGNVKPLREYISDKKEMIEQMFSCIEEHQLKKMIPDVLKEAKIDDIKAECLVELLGMSRKRILGILEGKELDESSEDSLELSDISDEELDIKSEKILPERVTKRKCQKESQKGVSSTKKSKQVISSDSEQDEDEESDRENTVSKKSGVEPKKKKKALQVETKETIITKTGKGAKKRTEEESNDKDKQKKAKVTNLDLDLGISNEKQGGKNLLEILELEMRARAIRSLLQREEKKNEAKCVNAKPSTSLDTCIEIDNDPDAVIVVEENVGDQIDLTVDDSDNEDLPPVLNKVNTIDISEPPDKEDVFIIKENDAEVASAEASDVNKNKPFSRKQKEFRFRSRGNSPDVKQSGEPIPKNWTERWLESNEVQTVMKTTKVLTNLKKRLISVNKQKALEKKSLEVQEVQMVEGTVDEYSQLPSKKKDIEKINSSEEINKLNKDQTLENIVDETMYNLSLDKLPISSEFDVKFQEHSSNEESTVKETDKGTTISTTELENMPETEEISLCPRIPSDSKSLSVQETDENQLVIEENKVIGTASDVAAE